MANSSFNLSWQLTSLFWPKSNTWLHSTKLSLHFLCVSVRLGTSPLIEYLIKASCRRDLRRIQVPDVIHHIFLAWYFLCGINKHTFDFLWREIFSGIRPHKGYVFTLEPERCFIEWNLFELISCKCNWSAIWPNLKGCKLE